MAGRIKVRQADQFPHGLYILRVSAAEEFEKVKQARETGVALDVQARDKDTGHRLWHVEVFNPAGEYGERDMRVKVPAEVMPVPPAEFMNKVELEGIELVPWVNEKGRTQLAYRSTGFVQPVKAAAAR